MKPTTSKRYRKRLTTVIDYIYQNLDGDLSVNTLAHIAVMSPYHFHRIYREIARETVNGTVRRLRLQRAASQLVRSDESIFSIARKVSYGSVEAFSRAFTSEFGSTPSEYRADRQSIYDITNEPFIAMLPIRDKVYNEKFTVDILDLDAVNLITSDHQGDYMEVGHAFDKLYMYASSHNLLNESTRSLGLYYDDPQSVPVNELRSKAGISIASDQDISLADVTGIEKITVPAGKYVSLLFQGPYPELEKPYDWLFGHWLPNSGYEAADFPPVEEYLNDPRETPPNELLTRICCLLA